jgi:riboflavin kinase/FMN adenylyltransferase
MEMTVGFSSSVDCRGGCVSIGNFDGVHRGHQRILSELVQTARRLGVPAVAMTFDPHPASLLTPGRIPPALTTLERKAELIRRMGVNSLLVVPTTRELLNLTAAEFFNHVLSKELQIRGVVEGTNFCFGKGRQGTVESLREMCRAQGLECRIVQPVDQDGQIVSSSTIRALLNAGEVAGAAAMLGRPHRATGVVVEGAGRGRTIGFPTANIEHVPTLLPAQGVYAARCFVDGVSHAAAVNLGPNPTFAEQSLKFEVHILDFAGDLYGKSIDVDYIARIRDVVEFESVEQLKQQLGADVKEVRRALR